MKPTDWLLFFCIAVLAVAPSWRSVPPAEDAAMLMRYIDHLAHGHGWVWNPGGPPEDGATDALFVMVASVTVWLTGLETEWVVRGLNLLAHLALLALIFRRWVRDFAFSAPLAAMLLTPLVAGPATCYVPAGFATPFFALVVALFFDTVWRSTEPALAPERSRSAGFQQRMAFFSALLVCLARPEGLFLVVPTLMWICGKSVDKKKFTVNAFLLGVLPGLCWLAWRQWYFGHIFPTPFYRKGGELDLLNGARSLYLGIMHVLPWLPVLVAGTLAGNGLLARRNIAWVAVLLFLGMFALLSNEMNFAARFQYAVVPALLLSPLMRPAKVWADRLFSLGGNHLSVIAGMLLVMGGFSFAWFRYADDRDSLQADPRDAVGRALHAWHDKGYRLCTTEAGLLPFRSGWQTLDAWGLNDYAIARAGVVSQARLRAFRPTVIMLDEHVISERSQQWLAMNDTLQIFTRMNGYQLAASYTTSGDSLGHLYFIDSQCLDAEGLKTAILRSLAQEK